MALDVIKCISFTYLQLESPSREIAVFKDELADYYDPTRDETTTPTIELKRKILI